MGNYRNFELTVYFVALGTQHATKEGLEKDLDFFGKHMRLDKVYLEPFRGSVFVDDKQVQMCKKAFEDRGIHVTGGMTTTMKDEDAVAPKQRMFQTLCYNDPKMMAKLAEVSAYLGKTFDGFIIDDFYFTNCTCEACRKGRDEYNAAHGITDGRWREYRLDLMRRVSEKYMIAPAKAQNPDCRITIKYPNWAESYQETGYNPSGQRDLFDRIYTGTETRDMLHQDQHLPRYLSFSLMTYFENMCPGRNGGGWFDPFDIYSLDQYLEQAYLTAFSKPKELMMFCFQALTGKPEVAALGYHLDKLDAVLDHLGRPVGVPCYVPDDSCGEDNIQDYLGMNGFPVVMTPYFPADAPVVLLTKASAYDKEVMGKLEEYVVKGGRAIVTDGFARAVADKGIHRISSVRFDGRRAEVSDYMTERLTRGRTRMDYSRGVRPVAFPVAEFRNNFTWALVKGIDGEENYGLLLKDTYGEGELLTLVVPDAFSRLRALPAEVLTRMRHEFAVNGIYLEGKEGVSLFLYDNDTVVLYPYVQDGMAPADVFLHVEGDVSLEALEPEREIPCYRKTEKETVFCLSTTPGRYDAYRIRR